MALDVKSCKVLSQLHSTPFRVLVTLLLLIGILAFTACYRYFSDLNQYGRLRLFDDDLPSGAVVAKWSPSEMDAKLHLLSRWGFTQEGWRSFVSHSVSGLQLPTSESTPFLLIEVGMGVGAFSRVLLQRYPQSKVIGVDLSPAAVKVARAVLPRSRAEVHVSDATNLGCIDDNVADFVSVPGVICYLNTESAVLAALGEMVRVAKPGARIGLTMIPETASAKQSCTVYLATRFWSSASVASLGLRLLEIQDMEAWQSADGGGHGAGRYAAFLRVEK